MFLADPISLFDMIYDSEFIVETERKSGNIIHLKSASLNIRVSLENNIDRDVATLLLRSFHHKFL